MCLVLRVARSAFYSWLHKPLSVRTIEDQGLLGFIRASYAASVGGYGAPRIFMDLREIDQRCGKIRVAHLMCSSSKKAQ